MDYSYQLHVWNAAMDVALVRLATSCLHSGYIGYQIRRLPIEENPASFTKFRIERVERKWAGSTTASRAMGSPSQD